MISSEFSENRYPSQSQANYFNAEKMKKNDKKRGPARKATFNPKRFYRNIWRPLRDNVEELHELDMMDYQRTEYALKHKGRIAAKAKANQQAGGGAVRQKSAEPVDTRNEIAKMANVSPDTVSKVEKIMEHADEKTKESLRRGDKGVSINSAFNKTKSRNDSVTPKSLPKEGKDSTEKPTKTLESEIKIPVKRIVTPFTSSIEELGFDIMDGYRIDKGEIVKIKSVVSDEECDDGNPALECPETFDSDTYPFAVYKSATTLILWVYAVDDLKITKVNSEETVIFIDRSKNMDPLVSIGLAGFLRSTFVRYWLAVEFWFTPVSAEMFRRLPCPDRKSLRKIGKKLGISKYDANIADNAIYHLKVK